MCCCAINKTKFDDGLRQYVSNRNKNKMSVKIIMVGIKMLSSFYTRER